MKRHHAVLSFSTKNGGSNGWQCTVVVVACWRRLWPGCAGCRPCTQAAGRQAGAGRDGRLHKSFTPPATPAPAHHTRVSTLGPPPVRLRVPASLGCAYACGDARRVRISWLLVIGGVFLCGKGECWPRDGPPALVTMWSERDRSGRESRFLGVRPSFPITVGE